MSSTLFFSEQLARLCAGSPPPGGPPATEAALREVVQKVEQGEKLQDSDLCVLLWAQPEAATVEAIERLAHRVKEKICGRVVSLVIPQYLTSYCQNECVYCAYRVSNSDTPRRRLALSEFEREFRMILDWGYRQVELVLADDPEFPAERVASYVRLARHWMDRAGGGKIAVNGPAYQGAQYRRLAEAGLDWLALWQETYQEDQFLKWHQVPSPKAHFRFRLDALDRALRAGIGQVAPGLLFGLADWRLDVLRLMQHCRYLEEQYGKPPYALGIPRLKPALGSPASGRPSRYSVSDLQYRLALAVLKLAVPQSRLFFNTREPLRFNRQVLCGGNLFTVDCATFPGGYLDPTQAGQFRTESYGQREELVRTLQEAGFVMEDYVPPEPALAAAGRLSGEGSV
ncbi:MAG: hypothetical protein A3H27_04895 [Acidobacteria bacterium RIFCSPLOWO2_02_FULL_59_13]|nr:MAG: hypothetical protein A3H27_04895 [Acidobacteria bacterium RIFCSPLOWO2_02_FULL_59_13]